METTIHGLRWSIEAADWRVSGRAEEAEAAAAEILHRLPAAEARALHADDLRAQAADDKSPLQRMEDVAFAAATRGWYRAPQSGHSLRIAAVPDPDMLAAAVELQDCVVAVGNCRPVQLAALHYLVAAGYLEDPATTRDAAIRCVAQRLTTDA